MGSDARIEPTSVDVVANEIRRLDHLHAVVDGGADFAADLDLLERNDHGADGCLPSIALGKKVPKLCSTILALLAESRTATQA